MGRADEPGSPDLNRLVTGAENFPEFTRRKALVQHLKCRPVASPVFMRKNTLICQIFRTVSTRNGQFLVPRRHGEALILTERMKSACEEILAPRTVSCEKKNTQDKPTHDGAMIADKIDFFTWHR